MFSECPLCTDHSPSMKRKSLTCSLPYIFNQSYLNVYIIPLSPIISLLPTWYRFPRRFEKLTISNSLKFKIKFKFKKTKQTAWTGVGRYQSKFLLPEISLLFLPSSPRLPRFGEKPGLLCKQFLGKLPIFQEVSTGDYPIRFQSLSGMEGQGCWGYISNPSLDWEKLLIPQA